MRHRPGFDVSSFQIYFRYFCRFFFSFHLETLELDDIQALLFIGLFSGAEGLLNRHGVKLTVNTLHFGIYE